MFYLRNLQIMSGSVTQKTLLLVALLRECIMMRDNVFTLPNFYTVADVQCIISYVCRPSSGQALLGFIDSV